MSISRHLLLACVAAAAAYAPLSAKAAQPTERLVTVSGEATVSAAPDTAVIRIGVDSEGKTAEEASKLNAKQMNAVLAAIKASGVAERDIQTEWLSLQPQYDTSKGNTARLTGFRATNQLSVKVHAIDKLPGILDRAIGAGANEMSGVEFMVSNRAKFLDAARSKAVADAHRKAVLYAQAAGVTLGPVMSISEEGSSLPPRPALAMRASSAAVPVAPGELTLRAAVTVSYELAP
jgi:uncharacterized protein